ncbi:hypothetical protein H2200_009861 [Cladophialophora chaetospira]|uniref:Heterokaryon incompatibility domain-containing protein n=1 Tax=Cladophialophora chaetospira TaxID=386627 RepID=A0AA38X3C1_9EURO|nr:hypothetical protein H2200_009861 [Cladophialophora chaetospira]
MILEEWGLSPKASDLLLASGRVGDARADVNSSTEPKTIGIEYLLTTNTNHAFRRSEPGFSMFQRQYLLRGFPFDLWDKLCNPLSEEARGRPLLPSHQALASTGGSSLPPPASLDHGLCSQPRRQRWTRSQLELEAQFSKDHRGDVRCIRCRSFDFETVYRQPGLYAELDLGTLEDVGANVRCPVCRFLHEEIKLWLRNQSPVALNTSVSVQFVPPISGEGKVLGELKIVLGDQVIKVKLQRGYSESFEAESYMRFGRFVHPTKIDMELVQQWIRECNGEHDCQRTYNRDATTNAGATSNNILQLTVIDVHRRLLVKPSQDVPYVALSYVWGPPPHDYTQFGPYASDAEMSGMETSDVVLSEQSLALMNGTLPRTLEDAVTFTKNLGLRYLWIDWLCIPQSDPKQKSLQIASMNQIYQNSHVTLVAADGTSVHDGIPGASPQSPRNIIQTAGYVDSLQPTPSFAVFEDLESSISAQGWDKRAWTLQEGVLSRRKVIVTAKQAYFACERMMESESTTATLFSTRSEKQYISTKELLPASLRRSGRNQRGERGENPGRWAYRKPYESFVYEFTARKMGFAEDALNAFRGLMGYLAGAYNVQFLFGLPLDCEGIINSFGIALLWGEATKGEVPTGASEGAEISPIQIPSGADAVGFPSWTWAGGWIKVEYRRGILGDFGDDEFPEPIFEVVDMQGVALPLVNICHNKVILDSMESDALKRGIQPRWRLRITTLAIALDIYNTNLSPFVESHMPWFDNHVQWIGRRVPRFVLDRKWWSGGNHNNTEQPQPWYEEDDAIHLVAPTREYRPDARDARKGSIDLLIFCTRGEDTWRRGVATVMLEVWFAAKPERKTFLML